MIQPVLPELAVSEKGESLVQAVLPELVVTEKGVPLVQAVLPELVVTEKGEPLVLPVLPELVVTEKGESLVQPVLPEFTLRSRKRTLTTPIKPGYVMLASMFLPEGNEKVDFPGKDGIKEEELEELVGPDGEVYNSKVLSTKETKPVLMVKRYGTLKTWFGFGGYRFVITFVSISRMQISWHLIVTSKKMGRVCWRSVLIRVMLNLRNKLKIRYFFLELLVPI